MAAIATVAIGVAAFLWWQPLRQAPVVPTAVAPASAMRQAPIALTVTVMPVVPQSLARVVVGDGSVVAWQELVIGTEAGGLRVVDVAVEAGDRVRRGQLLVRLEDTVVAAQRAAADATVAEAESALRIARLDLDRSVELARTQAVARQTLEQRQAAAQQAEARLAAARAQAAEAVARLAQTRIVAPTDGVVSRRATLLGAVVPNGQELVRLIRDGRLELDARVPELDLAQVVPGQRVQVLHGDRAIEGTVRALAPTVTAETRLGLVHVTLPRDSGLRPGMFARAEIAVGTAPVLAVPQSAVLFRNDRPALFVLPPGDDRVALRAVTAGARRDGMVEIVAGLAAGESVVVSGAGFLGDGDRVRVVPAPAGAR